MNYIFYKLLSISIISALIFKYIFVGFKEFGLYDFFAFCIIVGYCVATACIFNRVGDDKRD